MMHSNSVSQYLSRREMLRTVGGGFGTLGLASVLADSGFLAPATAQAETIDEPSSNPLAPKAPHFAPRAKRVIFLFMNGGPSHVDTYDPKPMLAKYEGQRPDDANLGQKRRGRGGLMPTPFKFDKYGEAGIDVSELFPETAKCVDDLCVIRSMHSEFSNHEPALLLMNSGNTQPIRPSMGSWVTYGLGTENQNLPGFVVLCPGRPVIGPALWQSSFLPAVFQGTHIHNKVIDPRKIIENVTNPYLTNSSQRQQLDLLNRLNSAHLHDREQDAQLEGRIESLELAFRMQSEAQEVFDIGKESATTRKMYGDGEFANGCLIARRLAEAGVRMVQVYYGHDQPWDAHDDIMDHKRDADKSDQPIAALLNDLKSRDLLDETLVIWGGEFGRTPFSEGSKGRDHHSRGFTMWLAGGGVKGGLAYGETDEFGVDAVEKPVHIHDLHATILHLLGMDHTKLTYRYSGRDFRLTDVFGKVVTDIIA